MTQSALDEGKSMHRVFRRFNAPFGRDASGHTEWFVALVAPFALVVMLVHQIFWLTLAFGLMIIAFWVANGCPPEPMEAFKRLIF